MSKLPMASLLSLVVGCGGGAGSPPPTPSPTDSATVPTSPTGTSTLTPTAATADTGVPSSTGDTAVASSATTADTSTTQIASSTATTADTASTSTASTGDTGAACDAVLGPNCYVEDGLCYAPDLAWTTSLHDSTLDAIVDQTQSGCGAVVATTCDDGSIVLARWSVGNETGAVDVYDATTRVWAAGYLITDDPYLECGGLLWIGDPTHQACGEDARRQMNSSFYGGCGYYTTDPSGACTVLDPACVIDEVKRP